MSRSNFVLFMYCYISRMVLVSLKVLRHPSVSQPWHWYGFSSSTLQNGFVCCSCEMNTWRFLLSQAVEELNDARLKLLLTTM